MRINMIVQARTSSTRLANKVLLTLLNKPMLAHQLARLQKVKGINDIIIATSTDKCDDPIETLCHQLNFRCYRGDLNDVLSRYYNASLCYPSEHIIRVTGDCPLIDPQVIEQVIAHHITHHCDYSSNCQIASYPDGLDVEIFTQQALIHANQFAKKPSEREHVTLHIKKNSHYKIGNITCETNLSHHRWTVDEKEDFELVKQIYQHLYPENPAFTWQDIIELLKQKPELCAINHQFMRNQGLAKSLKADKELGYE